MYISTSFRSNISDVSMEWASFIVYTFFGKYSAYQTLVDMYSIAYGQIKPNN